MDMLNRFSISSRLALIAVITLLGVLFVAGESLLQINEGLLVAKSKQTQNMVDAAHGVVSGYYEQFKSGELEEQDAQTLALNAVKTMRYDNGNYFWVNDYSPTIIMHPVKPQLAGKDLSGVKDSNGKHLYLEFVRVAKESGAGHVDYLWEKPGSSDPLEKVSYVKAFKPWGWIIGTGIYVDDVRASTWQLAADLAVYVVVIIVFLLAGLFFIAKSIVIPIRSTTSALQDLSKGEGDLTVRLPVNGEDEVAKLSSSFNEFVEKIHNIIVSVQKSSAEVEVSASELLSKSMESVASTEQQNAETAQIATASNEMVSTINEIAHSASTAAGLAQGANSEALEGKKVVTESANSVENLSTEIQSASAVIIELDSECSSIDSVLSVIKGIAEQTNLLALNAAIEAARAGEQGRGFAVVADEVRTLAGRTQGATLEINGIIEQLQSKAQEAVSAIETSSSIAVIAVEQAAKASDSLDSIAGSVNSISDANDHIATAAEEQSAVTREIDERVVVIADLANATNEIASDINSSSDTLKKLGQNVSELMATFKV
ncbi:methyl-accepting chemotaxis protein [Psychromonas ossibalaenae]|uniref:methyl-accepting chemotaxis protein n=1 Tax=Psychromonas ossibalaenae TaxID=444922 RepID=UPI0003693F7D|nr:methyl-accepting chemotaxis protein [Psychromonas ossibalaenae]